MTTIDFTFMAVLCYALGFLLGVIPEAAVEYWRLAVVLYAAKTALWLFLRIPLLLPVDRWEKKGAPPREDDPSLIRSIYYFPYDFSVFYGVLVWAYFVALGWILTHGGGAIRLNDRVLFPCILFGLAIGFGAIAIGVPVNLLLTAKFSKRLAERGAANFADIPGKPLSLQVKMATVAIALGCAPSLLLFSVQNLLQYAELYREASRTATAVAGKMVEDESGELGRWAMRGVHPFEINNGKLVFASLKPPAKEDLTVLFDDRGGLRDKLSLRERLAGYAVCFAPGLEGNRGVMVRLPEPSENHFVTALILLPACLWPLLTSMLTVQTIVKPVSVIAATFHRIIGRGRTEGTDEVPIFYKDEVGRLAFNANRTINILTEARRQLEKNSRDLEQKNRELKDAYRTKGEFLANMSHELRTPLNAIIGFSRLMKRKLKDTLPERQARNLEMIEQSGEQLLALVNDLLDFEKIEAGKLTVRKEETDLKKLLESLEAVLRPPAVEKGLELVFETEESPATVFSDQERLRQILTNLITNAVKYSDRGTITLRILTTDGGRRLQITVSDQGIGMTPEQIERIFDPFHQVDGSETRERGGVGLGLAIVGRLVDLLQGEISVSSEKGVGSTFTVVLPIVLDSTPVLGDVPLLDNSTGAAKGEILIVEDDPHTAQLLQQSFEEAGGVVRVAHTQEQALAAIEEKVPDCLVLDLELSHGSGRQVLAALRTTAGAERTRVVIYTAGDLEETERHRFAEGAVTVVHKHGHQSLQELLSSTLGSPRHH